MERMADRRIDLGPWRLVVAAGFSLRRRRQARRVRAEVVDAAPYHSPQYEAWLRSVDRRRAREMRAELGK